jgi:hypothetical protein
MAQAVSHRPLTAEARVQSQASPREICVAQSGIATGCSQCTSVLHCQCYFTLPFIYHRHYIILATDNAVK